jgi:hypothetical protein
MQNIPPSTDGVSQAGLPARRLPRRRGRRGRRREGPTSRRAMAHLPRARGHRRDRRAGQAAGGGRPSLDPGDHGRPPARAGRGGARRARTRPDRDVDRGGDSVTAAAAQSANIHGGAYNARVSANVVSAQSPRALTTFAGSSKRSGERGSVDCRGAGRWHDPPTRSAERRAAFIAPAFVSAVESGLPLATLALTAPAGSSVSLVGLGMRELRGRLERLAARHHAGAGAVLSLDVSEDGAPHVHGVAALPERVTPPRSRSMTCS